MNIHQFPKSNPVIVLPYREEWTADFTHIASHLHSALGDVAVQIDHTGSTSVSGLAAKNIIDVQVTVRSLDDPRLQPRLLAHGFRFWKPGFLFDEFVGMDDPESPDLRKLLAVEPEGERRANIHIREQGRLNQRYALLFRDYLRASPVVTKAYETIKIRLAEIFPDSIDGYLYIKDPLMDLIFEAAGQWAVGTGWGEEQILS
jgi:GrpB-like predicted nucleotidyltransferase (UPF0157 family)